MTLDHRLELTCCVFLVLVQTNRNTRLQFNFTAVVSPLYFGNVGKEQTFALTVNALTGGVVQAQNDILGRYDGRFTVGGEQHIVGCQHQSAGFQLRFQRQGNVNSHLVAVEVGVKRSTHQWMQLNGFAFNQYRLKSLNTQTVQRRCTIEHNRVFANDLFQNVPHHGFLAFNQLLGCLDCRGQTHHFQTIENEWLEQFQRH